MCCASRLDWTMQQTTRPLHLPQPGIPRQCSSRHSSQRSDAISNISLACTDALPSPLLALAGGGGGGSSLLCHGAAGLALLTCTGREHEPAGICIWLVHGV